MGQSPHMWHVTLTVAGQPMEPEVLRAALDRLAHERPFLLSARYAADRAELRYWDEADCVEDAAALALRLWGEHRASAELPPWGIVGLEVVDRSTFRLKVSEGALTPPVLVPAGGITPF